MIEYINSIFKLNKKIYYIPSKIIDNFPSFIKKILQKSKTLQQYDNYDWLKEINKNNNEFLIRKPNNKF